MLNFLKGLLLVFVLWVSSERLGDDVDDDAAVVFEAPNSGFVIEPDTGTVEDRRREMVENHKEVVKFQEGVAKANKNSWGAVDPADLTVNLPINTSRAMIWRVKGLQIDQPGRASDRRECELVAQYDNGTLVKDEKDSSSDGHDLEMCNSDAYIIYHVRRGKSTDVKDLKRDIFFWLGRSLIEQSVQGIEKRFIAAFKTVELSDYVGRPHQHREEQDDESLEFLSSKSFTFPGVSVVNDCGPVVSFLHHVEKDDRTILVQVSKQKEEWFRNGIGIKAVACLGRHCNPNGEDGRQYVGSDDKSDKLAFAEFKTFVKKTVHDDDASMFVYLSVATTPESFVMYRGARFRKTSMFVAMIELKRHFISNHHLKIYTSEERFDDSKYKMDKVLERNAFLARIINEGI